MAELHIVGSIVGGENFDDSSLFCKWFQARPPASRQLPKRDS
jgi:hypothetical protein